jgi:hypothetical protein
VLERRSAQRPYSSSGGKHVHTNACQHLTQEYLKTHNVALTAPVAAYVVSMGADGCILNRGAPSEILSQDQALTEEIKHEQEAIELEEELDGDEDYTKQASAKGAKVFNILRLIHTMFHNLSIAHPCGGDRTRSHFSEGYPSVLRYTQSLAARILDCLPCGTVVRPVWPSLVPSDYLTA